jgi:dTDP-4-dehydrorhamnose 3,5-epimerase
MNFQLTPISDLGAFAIQSNLATDSRGSMQRLWQSVSEFFGFTVNEVSHVTNPKKFTLRGLHFQEGSSAENKIVFCTSGQVYDVGVDLRKHSHTYLKHFSIEIGPASKFQGVVIPAGFAHGYMTLKRKSDLIYLMDKPYNPQYSSGALWSDPAFGIEWPRKPKLLSEKDRSWPTISA